MPLIIPEPPIHETGKLRLDAPLLLGQSALGRFGKVTIDNEKHELTME